MPAHSLLALGFCLCLRQGVGLVTLHQRVNSCGKHAVQPLHTTLALLHQFVHLLLLLSHFAQLGLKGIDQIVRFDNGVGGKFQRSLYLNGCILLGRTECLAQTTEKALLFRAGNDGVAVCNDLVLHPMLHNNGILPGQQTLNVFGRHQIFVGLAQGSQQGDGIGILFTKQLQEAIGPLHIAPLGHHEVTHLAPYKKQGEKQCRQQQYVADGDFYFGYVVHLAHID